MIPGLVNTITSKISKQVILTGASSPIGQRLVRSLAKEYNVCAIVRDKSRFSFHEPNSIQILESDLKSHTTLSLPKKESMSPSAIYLSLLGKNDEEEEMLGIKNVIDLLKAQHVPNCKSLFILTSGAYSGGIQEDTSKTVDEFSRNLKKSAWDRSVFENYAMSLADDRISVAVVRPGWVYGAPSKVDRWISFSSSHEKIPYTGDLNAFVPLVHIDDLIHLYLQLLQTKPSGIFYAVESSPSLLHILATVQSHLKLPIHYQDIQSMLENDLEFGHAMLPEFSCKVKATNSLQFGWKPKKEFAKACLESANLSAAHSHN